MQTQAFDFDVDEPILLHRRGVPARIGEQGSNIHHDTVDSTYHRLYFEKLDKSICEIEHSFDSTAFI